MANGIRYIDCICLCQIINHYIHATSGIQIYKIICLNKCRRIFANFLLYFTVQVSSYRQRRIFCCISRFYCGCATMYFHQLAPFMKCCQISSYCRFRSVQKFCQFLDCNRMFFIYNTKDFAISFFCKHSLHPFIFNHFHSSSFIFMLILQPFSVIVNHFQSKIIIKKGLLSSYKLHKKQKSFYNIYIFLTATLLAIINYWISRIFLRSASTCPGATDNSSMPICRKNSVNDRSAAISPQILIGFSSR